MPDRKSTVGTQAVSIIAPILLLIISTICGIIIIEILYDCYLKLNSLNNTKYQNGIMFFGGNGRIFENKNDIFTYSANKDIRSSAIYTKDDDFVVEYDYQFHTNNLGLVQDADIITNISSMLLLGDSFTQGLGAAPWFPQVAGEINNLGYQPINGGLLGTGFAQWSKLETYLNSSSVRISKIVVLFISDDYVRYIWNFSDGELQCFSVASSCSEERFYPLPSTEELSSWVNRIKNAKRSSFNERARRLLPASYDVYRFVMRYFNLDRLRWKSEIAKSDIAIAKLLEKYGTANVIFIHLPQKDEVGRANSFGLSARSSIEKAGGRVYDGFKLCGLTPSDYLANDPHPNEKGYEKIALCTNRIIKQQEWLQP